MSVRVAGAGRWVRFGLRSALVSAVTLLAPAASAQNRIALNPDLNDVDQDTHWTGTDTAWLATDDADACHLGVSKSGSLTASAVEDNGGPGVSLAAVVPGDCLAVTAGQTIYTEIAYKSPFAVGVGAYFFPQASCSGAPDNALITPNGSASAVWATAGGSIVVPANRPSMKIVFASFDFANSVFPTVWDRAYAGAQERVFSDDFEANALCRWSSSSS